MVASPLSCGPAAHPIGAEPSPKQPVAARQEAAPAPPEHPAEPTLPAAADASAEGSNEELAPRAATPTPTPTPTERYANESSAPGVESSKAAPSWTAILKLARASGIEQPVGRGPRLAIDERRLVVAIVHAARDPEKDCSPQRVRLSALLIERRPEGLELVARRQLYDAARTGYVDTVEFLRSMDDELDEVEAARAPSFRELAERIVVSARSEDVDGDGRDELLLRYAWSENCPGGGMMDYRNLAILDPQALALQTNLGVEATISEKTGVRFRFVDIDGDGHADLKGAQYSDYEGEEDEPFTARYLPAQDRYEDAPGPFTCTQRDVC